MKTNKKETITSSDSAIHKNEEDFFQRKEFAARISSLLENREDNSSFTLGIYGKWGEGKTSIINLIKGNLADTKIELVDFNPWMFSTEEQLLIMFFSTLHSKLESLTKSKGERAGQKMKDFSSIIGGALSITGVDVEKAINDLGSKLADKSLIQRKKEINDALIKENRKFVFFLDDLDRLNSEELFSIFRLIKLTGDFNNINYVLAFDDEIVARMLSERYSGEGHSYLEKIIQLPLKIPKAQKFDLNKYFFNKLEELLKKNSYEIPQYEVDEIQRRVNLFMLPFIDNPRIIVRLINGLEFIFPLLNNQVNLSDLILLEWIKISYPRVYLVLRENHSLLRTNFSTDKKSSYSFDTPKFKKEDLPNKLRPTLDDLSFVEGRQLANLIIKLFPYSKSCLTEEYCQEIDYKIKYIQKRVCSPDYFERYFTYVVLEGQISDIEFDAFIMDLINENITKQTVDFIKKTEKSNLAFKLSLFSSTLLEKYSYPFIKSLASISHFFPFKTSFMSSYQSMGLISSIVGNGIKEIPMEDQLIKAIEVFQVVKEIEFAIELWYILHPKKTSLGFDHFMAEEDFIKLTTCLFELTKARFSFEELVEKLDQRYSKEIILMWVNHGEKLNRDALAYINKNDENPMKLVKVFSSWISSSEYDEPYVYDFTTFNLEDLLKIISRTAVEKRLTSIYGKQKYPTSTSDRNPMSDEQITGTYQQYCRNYRRNQRRKKAKKK